MCNSRQFLGLALMLLLARTPRTLAADSIAAGVGRREALAEVILNGHPVAGASVLLFDDELGLLLPVSDVTQWRMSLPAEAMQIECGGRRYVTVRSVIGLTAAFDENAQRLDLKAAPALLPLTRLSPVDATPSPTLSPLGAYANYDLGWQRDSGSHLAALGELGIFRGRFVASSTFLDTGVLRGGRPVRLDSTLTADFPQSPSSLRIGDGIAGTADGRGAVRFGGIQWGTDFGITPDFITFPLPAFRGAATLPSTVDLYVNNVLALRNQVPPGPFTVNQLPISAGAGQVELTVQDALGRQQIVTQNYYIAPQLLKAGLGAWSAEAGALRRDYALRSDDYGAAFAGLSARRGISDTLTTGLSLQSAGTIRNFAAMADVLQARFGVWSLGAVLSDGNRSRGAAMFAGFERAASNLGVGMNVRHADRDFHSIDQQDGERSPVWELSGHMSWSDACCGSVGLFAVAQKNRGTPDVRALTLTAERPVFGAGTVSLLLTRDFARGGAKFFYLTYTRAFGQRQSAGVSADSENGQRTLRATLQQSLPRGPGFGYRLSAAQGDTSSYEGVASWQNSTGAYSLDAARLGSQTAYRADASGAVAWLGGEPQFTRRIDQSFAIVEVPGLEDQPVFQDQQLVANTDSHGVALLHDLRPFEINRISLDASRLPLEAAAGDLQMEAVPYRHGGLLLRFDVEARGRLVRLVQENGVPVPAGAVAHSKTHDFPVATAGNTYVSGSTRYVRLEVAWRARHCMAQVDLSESGAADSGDSDVPDGAMTAKRAPSRAAMAGRAAHLTVCREACRVAGAVLVLSLCGSRAQALGVSCGASATAVAFGAYDPASVTALDSTGTVSISCTGLVGLLLSWNFSFNTGGSGSFSARRMTSGINTLSYNLYTTAGRTTVLGDGSGSTQVISDSVTLVVGGYSMNYAIYGRIPAQQDKPPGNYIDTITVTLNYN